VSEARSVRLRGGRQARVKVRASPDLTIRPGDRLETGSDRLGPAPRRSRPATSGYLARNGWQPKWIVK